MIEQGYYSLNKILSMTDAEDLPPAFYFICGNRGPGKTFAVKTYMLRRFLSKQEKFIVFRRHIDQLDGCGEAFFGDIAFKFPDYIIKDMAVGKQPYRKLMIKKADEGEWGCCGYEIALNASNKIRELVGIFCDSVRGFFDEFQAEDGRYLPHEVNRLVSIMISISRGHGTFARDFPVFMCSNAVDMLNPYFRFFNVNPDKNTHFLKGMGWILEVVDGKEAKKALEDSSLGRALKGTAYMKYATGERYLTMDENFIVKAHGERYSIATIECDGEHYGIWEMQDGEYAGMIYLSHKYNQRERVYTFSIEDHRPGSLLTSRGGVLCRNLLAYFKDGRLYFEDEACKRLLIDMIGLSYNNT